MRLNLFIYTNNQKSINLYRPTHGPTPELLLGGGIRHITATSQYHAHSKQVPACISNIVICQYGRHEADGHR